MADKGIDMLRRLLGDERAIEIRNSWAKLSPDFAHFVTNFLAGEIWSRPQLDLKTRSLVTIAGLTALNRPNGLRLNVEMALRNGATKQEILETLLQMAPYAGFPACWEGLLIADEVFKQKKAARK
ncbi:MAG: carboxymuconolactone decarboxylase family protein [Acidobacteria bacterium]|nr:carboxymuconolactone decarboxylase family protein [Acidobacteriota bacterium]